MNSLQISPSVKWRTKTALKQNTLNAEPMGSTTIPSQVRMVATDPRGRASRSSGMTTVGPDTTRMAPSTTATRRGSSKNRTAATVASTQVMRTPTVTSQVTGRRMAGPSSLTRSSSPPRKSRMPTLRDTTGNRASPKISSESTSPSHGPTTSPPASSSTIEGKWSSRASHCSPTPSTMMKPIPTRMSLSIGAPPYPWTAVIEPG